MGAPRASGSDSTAVSSRAATAVQQRAAAAAAAGAHLADAGRGLEDQLAHAARLLVRRLLRLAEWKELEADIGQEGWQPAPAAAHYRTRTGAPLERCGGCTALLGLPARAVPRRGMQGRLLLVHSQWVPHIGAKGFRGAGMRGGGQGSMMHGWGSCAAAQSGIVSCRRCPQPTAGPAIGGSSEPPALPAPVSAQWRGGRGSHGGHSSLGDAAPGCN